MKNCLIGKDINYSMSPLIHHEFGDYSYCVKNLKEEELEKFFLLREYDGFNVTIPFKEKVIKYIDELDETALKTGAVNTVILRNGRYRGYNTDVTGFEQLLKTNGIDLTGKNVMLLGSGGAAKACYYVLEKEGSNVITVKRNGEINYSNLYNYSPDIIINATPVGNVSNFERIIDINRFKNIETVIDLSYSPIRPRLLIDAGKFGIKCVSGLDMLISQAAASYRIFTGEEPAADTGKIRDMIVGKMRNIVLIGMPGSGKTTIGRILAQKTGYGFIDTDEEIEKAGKTIDKIFKENGEASFRETETLKIKETALKNNFVISCGGGVVLKEENMDYLMSNGIVVLINRDTAAEDIPGRPLIKSYEDKKRLSEERKPLYDKYAQIVVNNNKTAEECALTIMNFVG